MTTNANRQYPTVSFPEYLDGGYRDIALPDRQLAAAAVSATADQVVESAEAPKPLPGRPWVLSGYSRVCLRLLGVAATGIDFPGGMFRQSCRLSLADGREVIATRRDAQGRAQLEAMVLQQLFFDDAPVPEPLGFNGVVLLQQALPGTRLSEMIRQAEENSLEQLLGKALESLAGIHRKAEHAGLDTAVPLMGAHPDWLIALLDRPAVLGGFFGIACPLIDIDALFDLLAVYEPRFVKWDARPGNAVTNADGRVFWFDWEHCCARNRLDDMVWLLCDETVSASFPAMEDRLIEAYLPLFADGRSPEEAATYLRVAGVLHSCVRLGRILHAKGNGSWQDADRELGKSEPLEAKREARRLCLRAARWAGKTDEIAVLSTFFSNIAQRLER